MPVSTMAQPSPSAIAQTLMNASAPPVCGVYGVFNYRHHVLIGRADNLREALSEALEMNREDARKAAGESFEEVTIQP